MRTVLALVAGMIAAVVGVVVFEMIGHAIVPPPAGIDWSDPVIIADSMREAPFEVLLLVILAWVLGTAFGTCIATLIQPDSWLPVAVIGTLLMLAGLSTIYLYEHPWWFSAFAHLTVLPAAYAGWGIGLLLRGRAGL